MLGQTLKFEKAWGDYSSEEDVDRAPSPPPPVAEVKSPQRRESPPPREAWTEVRNGRGKRRSRGRGRRRGGNKKRPPLVREGRAEAYQRRSDRVRELVLADPWQEKEVYHAALESEERKMNHSHIPTVQYVHSILFTLMNEGRGVTSRFEEGTVTWGAVEEEEAAE